MNIIIILKKNDPRKKKIIKLKRRNNKISIISETNKISEYFSKSNVTEEKVERFNSTLKLDVHTFKILLPGRLTKWKGQEMFLEAIKLLKTKYYKTNFK